MVSQHRRVCTRAIFCFILVCFHEPLVAEAQPELQYCISAETVRFSQPSVRGFLAQFEPSDLRSIHLVESAEEREDSSTAASSWAIHLKNSTFIYSHKGVRSDYVLPNVKWVVRLHPRSYRYRSGDNDARTASASSIATSRLFALAQDDPARMVFFDAVSGSVVSETQVVVSAHPGSGADRDYQCATQKYIVFTETALLRYAWLHGPQALLQTVTFLQDKESSRQMSSKTLYGAILTSDQSSAATYHPSLYMIGIGDQQPRAQALLATYGPDIEGLERYSDLSFNDVLNGKKSFKKRITGLWCSNHTITVRIDALERAGGGKAEEDSWFFTATDTALASAAVLNLGRSRPDRLALPMWYSAWPTASEFYATANLRLSQVCVIDNHVDEASSSVAVNPTYVYILSDGRILFMGCDADLTRFGSKEDTILMLRKDPSLALKYREACIGDYSKARQIATLWKPPAPNLVFDRSHFVCNDRGFSAYVSGTDQDQVATWVFDKQALVFYDQTIESSRKTSSSSSAADMAGSIHYQLEKTLASEYWFSNQRTMPVYYIAGQARIFGSSSRRAKQLSISTLKPDAPDSAEFTAKVLRLLQKTASGFDLTPQEQMDLLDDVSAPIVDMELPPDDANVADVTYITTGLLLGLLFTLLIVFFVILMICCIPNPENE